MPAHSGVRVKVCGVTCRDDARACVAAGVDYIGLNFWPGTPRCCSLEEARAIAQLVRGSGVRLVGVFVDQPPAEIEALRRRLPLDLVQLHGDEPPRVLEGLLPMAFKAIRIGDATPAAVLESSRRFGGEHLLLDAHVPGQVGGTGRSFDWSLAAEVAKERKLFLAGGLRPANVEAAVAAVAPFAVDVASGVERAPGRKDPARVRALVAAVHRATVGRSGP